MRVSINPGSGPVAGATDRHAIRNMLHFIVDCQAGCKISLQRVPRLDRGGRFGFLAWCGQRCHEIRMPGLPLEQVRYMDEPGQDIWDFPRLYVDGSSWVWKFGLLGPEEWSDEVFSRGD